MAGRGAAAALVAAGMIAGGLVVQAASGAAPRPMSSQAFQPPDPVQQLTYDVGVLEKRVAALEAQNAQLASDVEGLRNRIAAHPAGMSHARIVKLDWDKIPDDALLDYWVRDDGK